MRIGSDDPPRSGFTDGLSIVVAQGAEQRLLAKTPNFMTTVFLGGAQNSKILSYMVQNFRRGLSNRLYAVVVGSNAVYKIQSARALAIQDLDPAGLLQFPRARPIRPFLRHLAVGIAATVQRLERLLQRLRHVSVIHQTPPQINDFVYVFHQQRAFFLARAAGGAG